MKMKYSVFFEKDDNLKYEILRTIIHHPGMTVSQNQLFSQLDLSPYRLEQAVNDLNADFQTLQQPESHIDLTQKGVITGFKLSTLLLQEISLMYINRSPLFTVLQYHFFYDHVVTKTLFREQHFLSKTGFYTAEIKVKQLLQDSDLFDSQTASDDPEYTIRLHLFQLFYTLYNGIESPFDELNDVVQRVLDAIQTISTKQLLPTQVSKLSIFIRIWLLRIANKHELNTTLLQEPIDLSPVAAVLEREVSQTELDFLGAFLLATDILPEATKKLVTQVTTVSNKLTETFMRELMASPLDFSDSFLEAENIKQTIAKINIQFFSFYNEPTTFISPSQVEFFQQTYPLFDIIIGRFLQDVANESIVELNRNDQVNL